MAIVSNYNPARTFDRGEFERVRRVIGGKVMFIQGDVAVSYGAMLAGCRFFAGGGSRKTLLEGQRKP